MTDKERALNVIAKQIKDLDNNALVLDVLKDTPLPLGIKEARGILFSILKANGFELTKDYKLIPKK